MAQRINDEYKIKIFILYMLDNLDGELTYDTLNEIVLWDGTVNFFIYCDCFDDLLKKGAISSKVVSGEEVYSITPMGKDILSAVEGDLLEQVKKKLLTSAARLLAFKKNGSRSSTEVTKYKDGYSLECKIQDNKRELLSIKLYLDNLIEAELLRSRFDEKSEVIYRGVVALLSGEAKLWK